MGTFVTLEKDLYQDGKHNCLQCPVNPASHNKILRVRRNVLQKAIYQGPIVVWEKRKVERVVKYIEKRRLSGTYKQYTWSLVGFRSRSLDATGTVR